MKLKLYFILFLILLAETILAQQYNFKNLNVEDGLAQSQVFSICQDKDGNIWIGTFGGGVSKYDGFKFENFTTSEGLPSNAISSIIEDKNGNLWFATDNGITKYIPSHSLCKLPDGIDSIVTKGKFINYSKKHGLVGESFWKIVKDKFENLWFLSFPFSNVTVLHNESLNDSVPKIINIPVKDVLLDSIVYYLINDDLGNVYLATYKGINIINALHIENTDSIKNNIKYLTPQNGLLTDTIYGITKDLKGNIWISSRRGISMLDPIASQRLGSFVLTHYPQKGKLEKLLTTSIFADNNNNIWIEDQGKGIVKLIFSRDMKEVSDMMKLSMENGLSNNTIRDFLTDREGNIWFGTDGGGVSKFSGAAFSSYTAKDGLAHDIVFSIYEDKKGRYWFATYGGGFSIFNPHAEKEKQFQNFSKTQENFISNVLGGIKEDKYGYLWVSTRNGVARINPETFPEKSTSFDVYDDKNGIPGREVNTPYIDSKSNVWLGLRSGILKLKFRDKPPSGKHINDDFISTHYSKKNGLIGNFIRCIMEDHKGNIWIATTEGISVLPVNIPSDTTQLFKNYTVHDGLPHNGTLAIIETRQNQIWTAGENGVTRYYPETDTFQVFNRSHGLSSDLIYLIQEDNDGNLWFGTNKGIDKFTFEKDGSIKVKNYGKLEGFTGIETNHTASYKDSKGNLWFGTVKGVIKYDPNEDKVNKAEPLTSITKIQLFLKDAELPVNAIYTYDQNYFTFYFSGISHTIPEKVNYQFMLEGFDKEWLPITPESKVTYSNILPGEYTFMVKACNNDNVWNSQPAAYSFEITPPFWKTWWFYILCVIVGVSITYSYFVWKTKELLKAKKILEDKVEERTAELKKEKEKVEKINLELEKLSLVASETDNAVVIANEKGNIEWINDGFTRMHGYTLEELKSEKGTKLIEVSANKNLAGLIKESINNKQSIIYETIHVNNKGNEYWISSTLTPIFDQTGKLRKIVIIDTDISELKKVQAELERSNKELDDFASIVSHDLKEPLRKVMTYANKLTLGLGHNITDEFSDFIDQIQNATGRMKVLIEDVLNYSRVTTKKAAFEKTDLNVILKEVISDLEVRIKETNGKVETQKLPVIDADKLQMRQVFQNIIANGLKFHRKDVSPVITIHGELIDNGVWRISIKDNGVGFDEKYLDRLFKPFYRLHSKQEFEGTGMGTAICEKIIKRHGGNLTAKSQLGVGSTFIFTLPEKQTVTI